MLIIGDSPSSDLRGGMTAGIFTCWYNPKGNRLPAGVRADVSITNLWEVKGLLARFPEQE
jgi:2-haloacid dehalogenase